MNPDSKPIGAYTVADDIADYILGITYEIWEGGGIDLCRQYYADNCTIYSLDGITRGAQAVIDGTRSMLAAYPNRLLLGDDVITSGDCRNGYSSHRVLSPAVNDGESLFGPSTGRAVRFMNMADCVIDDGVIVREWLARDNRALVTQLGFDPVDSARVLAARKTDELGAWFESETVRLNAIELRAEEIEYSHENAAAFADRVVAQNWMTVSNASSDRVYAPYAVLHRSPVELHSGREAVVAHYAMLRSAFAISATSVDHCCVQNWGDHGDRLAIRWAVTGRHAGDYYGISATGKPVYIMGVTHCRIVNNRIASEWTVFDSLAVMGQLLSGD